MNIIQSFRLRAGVPPAVFALFSTALGCIPGLVRADSAEAAVPPAGESKPYALFLGADFEVAVNKQFYRALDVSRGSFVVEVQGRKEEVPMSKGAINMKVYNDFKLTDNSATILDLKTERAYTPANDPHNLFKASAAAITVESNSMGMAGSQMDSASIAMLGNGSRPWTNPGSGLIGDARVQAAAQIESAYNGAAVRIGSQNYSVGYHAGEMEEALAKELYDALDITFEVSSPKPLDSPYIAFVAQYRERDEKPGTVHRWIYAQEIEAIGTVPHKLQIKKGGFPPGFQLLKFQFHLYNRGRELATNVAEKHVSLTRSEAFDYILIDYLGTHKGATAPAAPALGRLSSADRSRLTDGQYRQTFYVKVNKEGMPVSTYLDEACAQKVDDGLIEEFIKEVRFKPALAGGRPVDGVARLKLSELTL